MPTDIQVAGYSTTARIGPSEVGPPEQAQLTVFRCVMATQQPASTQELSLQRLHLQFSGLTSGMEPSVMRPRRAAPGTGPILFSDCEAGSCSLRPGSPSNMASNCVLSCAVSCPWACSSACRTCITHRSHEILVCSGKLSHAITLHTRCFVKCCTISSMPAVFERL